ncbi:hypothetical protein EDD86DRAFT_219485 [Gorgonomyces haynaldii]|nr:hypothetical protein EDD86DRAFT_219485 [Gorgonomyces haynaldii]
MLCLIDFDCFYAQCHELKEPDIKNKPLGIRQKGIIVTCNYLARQRGVKKLQKLSDALESCPELVIRDGSDTTLYRELSVAVFECLRLRLDICLEQLTRQKEIQIERQGLDELFMDLTPIVEHHLSTRQIWPDKTVHFALPGFEDLSDPPVKGFTYKTNTVSGHLVGHDMEDPLIVCSHVVKHLRKLIHQAFGLTCSAGISFNKLFCKIGGQMHKPRDQTVVLNCDEAVAILDKTKIAQIPGFGHSRLLALEDHGIDSDHTCEIARSKITLETLSQLFAKEANVLWDRLHGIDNTAIKRSSHPKQMSIQDSFSLIDNPSDFKRMLRVLSLRLLDRYKKEESVTLRFPKTIKITWGKPGFESSSKSFPIPDSFFKETDRFVELAIKKLSWTETPPMRTLNVCLCDFGPPERKQLPPSVDPQVFQDLPPDIQQEILLQTQKNIVNPKKRKSMWTAFYHKKDKTDKH